MLNYSSTIGTYTAPLWGERPPAQTGSDKNWSKEDKRKTDQVGEVVSILSTHQPAGVTEASDVLDVGLKSRRVRLEHDVNERREKVISGGRLILGDLNGTEDVFTAACDAQKFFPRNPLRVHLDDICKSPR